MNRNGTGTAITATGICYTGNLFIVMPVRGGTKGKETCNCLLSLQGGFLELYEKNIGRWEIMKCKLWQVIIP